MVQILKRKIKAEKQEVQAPSTQVSLNSWGHLAIRLFGRENEEEDQLIVFTASETRAIRNFLRGLDQSYDP